MTFVKKQKSALFSLRTTGIIQIILSGICFGSLGIFGKTAYKHNISPGELLSLRYLVSAILMAIFIFATKPKTFFSLSAFEVISSLLLGIFGYALFSSLYFTALTGLSASLTVLLFYTYPMMIVLFSRLFLKEKIEPLCMIALTLVSIGLVGLVWGEWKIGRPLFLMFGIGSAFFYALYIILSQKYLSKTSPILFSFYVQLGAGTILSLIHFSSHPSRAFEIFSNYYGLLLAMSFLCSVLAMTLFLAGLQKVSLAEASLFSTTEPIFGVIFAIIFLGEKIQIIHFVGGVFILIGLILISLRKVSHS